LSLFQTGVALIPLVVVLLPVALLVGNLIPRYGVKPFFYVGAVFGLVGYLLLSTSASPLEVGGCLTLYAVGGGMVSVALQNLLVLSLDKAEMGLGTSLNTSFRYIGQSLGAPLAGAILTTYVATQSVSGHPVLLPTRAAFDDCFYLAGITFVLVGLLALFAREVFRRRTSSADTSLTAPTGEEG